MKLSLFKLLRKVESVRKLLSLIVHLAQYLDEHYRNDKTIKELLEKIKIEIKELK